TRGFQKAWMVTTVTVLDSSGTRRLSFTTQPSARSLGGGSCQQVRQGLFVPTHHRPLASHGDGTAPQTRLPGQECDPLLVAQFLTGQTQLPKAAASGGNQIPHASRQELSQLANLILRRHVRVVTAL